MGSETAPFDKSTARRRLLRGAFAVPTVATLYSGSALAAASGTRTFNNLPKGVAPINAPKPASETFWRIPSFTVLTVAGPMTVFKGTDVKAYEAIMLGSSAKAMACAFQGGKIYSVLDGHAEVLVDPALAVPTGKLLGVRVTCWTPTGKGSPKDFQITGVADSSAESGAGRAMTGSCWASVV